MGTRAIIGNPFELSQSKSARAIANCALRCAGDASAIECQSTIREASNVDDNEQLSRV